MNTGSRYNKSFSTDQAFHGHNGNNWITTAGH